MNKIALLFKNKIYVTLFLITFLAAFIRFYKLSEVPVSLYWDEVSTGYNAYSIEKSQRDEYGNFMPVLFRAYNDYKMPLNIYLTAVSTKFFGLNEFSVRFPSALSGTLTVFVTFFLTRLLLSFLKKKEAVYTSVIPLLASLFLAISPWHIQFSRAGFEANIALFFVILGVYLLFKGISSYRFYLISFVSFALALYGYRSVFIFVPIFLIVFLIIWRKELLKYGLLKLLVGIIIFAFMLIPLVKPLAQGGSTRFQQTSISNSVEEKALKSFQNGKPENKKILYVQTFLQGYFSEFSPQFLFFTGDPQGRHSPRGMGVLYIWEMPFLILGVWFLFKKFKFPVIATLVVWILSFPIAASLSIPTPHALRALNFLPIPQILSAFGLVYTWQSLPINTRKAFALLMSVVVLALFMNFVYRYSISNTKLVVSDWGDGYKQLVTYVGKNEYKYDKIIVSGHYWQPYMYFLFYDKFDPKKFQQTGDSTHFGKYLFGGTSWDLAVGKPELNQVNLRKMANTEKALVVLSPEEYHDQQGNVEYINKINDYNNKTVFIITKLK